ncbi:MAG: threonylcarbamoyl-AMP synthase [Bacteroidia bacterium]|nr:threonylcarbamoyl-AMP synthase [Bacteroidia bacterium]
MLLPIHPKNPPERLLQKVVDCLRKDGVIIYPTDTVYGLGCDIYSKKGIERICKIKNISPEKSNFSCICESVSIISDYAVQVSTSIYKMMKRTLPGPYTYVLRASKKIPRHFQSERKTVGIRVVDNHIVTDLVRLLGNPMLTTSLREDDNILEYLTDPELIHEKYKSIVDMVIDGGQGGIIPSTLVDCSFEDDTFEVIREGAGSLELLY